MLAAASCPSGSALGWLLACINWPALAAALGQRSPAIAQRQFGTGLSPSSPPLSSSRSVGRTHM
eukprot:3493772-Alexandrium_andersonii.AAC.1